MGPTIDPGADVVMARLAHQLCTLLHAAVGFVDLLAAAPLPDDQHRNVASLRATLDHVLTMVDDVLAGPGRVPRVPPAT